MCSDEVVALWVKANPERRKEILRKYADANIEDIRSRSREYAQTPEARAKNTAWKNNHREQIRADGRAYAATHKQENLERGRIWGKNNPAKIKAKGQRRYAKELAKPFEERPWNKNKEKTRNSLKRWRAANPVKVALQKSRRRALKANAAGSTTAEQLQARIDYYGGCCWVCQKPYEAIDHVISLDKGGTNWPANLRPICKHHNSRKINKAPLDFLRSIAEERAS